MRFSVARSAFTTAAAAGAVNIIRNQRLVYSLNPQHVVGPAARLFFECFECFVVENQCIQCIQWSEFSCSFVYFVVPLDLLWICDFTQKNLRSFYGGFGFHWLPDQDSNLDKLNQNQLCYHYTIGQSSCLMFSLAARPGLEPRQTEPESVVLPLHHRALF